MARKQQQRNVFCAVRGEILYVEQVYSESVSWELL
jgi:hypothetical protein